MGKARRISGRMAMVRKRVEELLKIWPSFEKTRICHIYEQGYNTPYRVVSKIFSKEQGVLTNYFLLPSHPS
jgi:Cdc6-like AAA superfamily ATPase